MFFISRTNKANGGRMIEILNLIAISIFSSGIQKNICLLYTSDAADEL